MVLCAPRHDIAARIVQCIQLLVEPGGHPSNYGPGPALLNFSDRVDADEVTPYSDMSCEVDIKASEVNLMNFSHEIIYTYGKIVTRLAGTCVFYAL